ncbi:MAG: holo-ACP synthase [Bacteroides sp.]|nr:holo-ACP synthase [Prevotella sp.]MCM1407344.1 holo-ACP synthase [Treponema brennaborense]MCM1469834.1 holo-ACP synthase [Bacteroides sp.]
MITGLGIDIVENRRFKKWLENPELIDRYFHRDETAAWEKKGRIVSAGWIQHFAARFAAKEAFGKALGSGIRGFPLKDICVVHDANGKPEYAVYGGALELFEKNGAERIFLSLSHEKEYSVAVAVFEK